jgi:sugar (pentulose or hexulose) kinase
VWPQIIADILAVPVLAPPEPAVATAFGAYRIAQRALRLPANTTPLATLASPRADRVERLRKLRARFAAATDLVRQIH